MALSGIVDKPHPWSTLSRYAQRTVPAHGPTSHLDNPYSGVAIYGSSGSTVPTLRFANILANNATNGVISPTFVYKSPLLIFHLSVTDDPNGHPVSDLTAGVIFFGGVINSGGLGTYIKGGTPTPWATEPD